jgi:AraC-like DNA-binding protein
MSKSLSPKPTDRAPFLFPLGAAFHTDSLVLHATARHHVAQNIAGPLSIKTVMRGEGTWRASGREWRVKQGEFLILNAGEVYSIEIGSPSPVTTCCVFFAKGFVERMALDATSPLAASLDDPMREGPALDFLSHWHTGPLTARVQSLAARCNAEPRPTSFEEDFAEIAHAMLHLHAEMQSKIARVPAARASTRKELFKRLERGRQYLYANDERGVSLLEAARVAALSPYHFHRAFREVFQTTPHAYSMDRRMERAKERIYYGALVADAADVAGFANPPAFTRLFRRRYGMSPTEFRKNG